MRKLFWLTILLAFSVCVYSQTQQGVVKTRGRMVNGVLQPGRGLDGATVQIAGRQAVVSKGNGGNFSFPVSSQKYRIEKVQKQGYMFIATIDNGDTPAYQQGMSGEYVVLEFTEWAINEPKSLFDIIDKTRGKPKYTVVMKDDTIKEYLFENRIGAHIDLKKSARRRSCVS